MAGIFFGVSGSAVLGLRVSVGDEDFFRIQMVPSFCWLHIRFRCSVVLSTCPPN